MTVTALAHRRPSTPRPTARPGRAIPAHPALWLAAARNATDWVTAAPFGAHLRFLTGTSGLHWQVVGEACGLPPRTTRRLLRLDAGTRPLRRLPRSSAARLLALRPADLLRWRSTQVLPDRTLALLTALARIGWDESRVAHVVAARPDELAAVRERHYCSELVARQVEAAWHLASGADDEDEDEDLATLPLVS